MAWAILDSNIYIGHWEHGWYQEELSNIRSAFVVRYSAIVLSELCRGARSPAARQVVATLHRIAKVRWSPTEEDWWEAGRLIQKIGNACHWESHKRQEFQNDALIALTARRYGATVVTANRTDFALLEQEVGISVRSPTT